MDILSIIILVLIAIWFAAAVIYILKNKGGCSCGSMSGSSCNNCNGCSGCNGCKGCMSCSGSDKKEESHTDGRECNPPERG